MNKKIHEAQILALQVALLFRVKKGLLVQNHNVVRIEDAQEYIWKAYRMGKQHQEEIEEAQKKEG